MALITAFDLRLAYLSKTKAEMAAIILSAGNMERVDEFALRLPDTLRRNVANPEKYRQIRDTGLRYKAENNALAQPLEMVLHSTFDAMKDPCNPLYDPLQANNVCVGGRLLLLLDLIEHIESVCELIQSDMDGLIVKMHSEEAFGDVYGRCREWQTRSRMVLECERFDRVVQKDAHNYFMIKGDRYKSKGVYAKQPDKPDNDMSIVNKAVIEYVIRDIDPADTVHGCNRLIEFQKVVKVGGKYRCAMHGDRRLNEEVLQVVASRSNLDPGICKVKSASVGEWTEQVAGTPSKCFIDNGDIRKKQVPRKLDKEWYTEVAWKEIMEFSNLTGRTSKRDGGIQGLAD